MSESQAVFAKYGLPLEVRYCKRCVISNQRPNSVPEHLHTIDQKKTTIAFDEEGICDACRVVEERAKIDWKERELQLRALCDKYRKNDGSYDVLIPGSGGKDSFMQSWILKHKYGMHPLSVTWAPGMYTDWGQRNHNPSGTPRLGRSAMDVPGLFSFGLIRATQPLNCRWLLIF